MPRRNRNASVLAVSPDVLAGQAADLASALSDASRPLLLGVACRVNPATTGDYCALCKGRITATARRDTLRRR